MRRTWHPWWKWECYPAGFYAAPKSDGEKAREAYAEFLSDLPRFRAAMRRVLDEWPHSCEHFLSNQSMNRIAWLGQAAMCIETGLSSVYRGGFKIMSARDQERANRAAAEVLAEWEKRYDDDPQKSLPL